MVVRVLESQHVKQYLKPFPDVQSFARIVKLLHALKDGRFWKYKLIHDLMRETGMRVGMAVAVQEWDFLNEEYTVLRAIDNKHPKELVLTISTDLGLEIRQYCDLNRHRFVNGYLFPSEKTSEEHLTAFAVRQFNMRLRTRYGLPRFQNHDWRRLFITDANDVGGLQVAQILAGHDSCKTTSVYVQKALYAKRIPKVHEAVQARWKERMLKNAKQRVLSSFGLPAKVV